MSDKNRLLMIGIMILLMGLSFIVDGFITGYRVIKWPSVQGTILSSDLQECSRGRSGRGLMPKISYSYSVDNATYVGNRIEPIGYSGCMQNNKAQDFIEKYSEQDDVYVYFNHDQTVDSFILGGKIGHWYAIAMVLGGILCIFWALFFYQ